MPGLHARSTTRRARRNYTLLIQFRPGPRIVGEVNATQVEFHPGSSIGRGVVLYSSSHRSSSPPLIVTKQTINNSAIGNMVYIGSHIEGGGTERSHSTSPDTARVTPLSVQHQHTFPTMRPLRNSTSSSLIFRFFHSNVARLFLSRHRIVLSWATGVGVHHHRSNYRHTAKR